MSLFALILLGLGLAMDAFAVSIAKGLALGGDARVKHGVIVGAWFGVFQGMMPLIGFHVAGLFAAQIRAVDHWIAFALLLLIGANMIRGSFGEPEEHHDGVGAREMVVLAVATSIDALAVGVSLRFTDTNPYLAAVVIGVVTFLLSAVGVRIGRAVGGRLQRWATLLGGGILILIGTKILLEDLGVIPTLL